MDPETHVQAITFNSAIIGYVTQLEAAGFTPEDIEAAVDRTMREWARLDAYFGIAIDLTADRMHTDRTVLYFLAAHAYLVEIYCG
jgi:hypothetical protein